MYVFSSISKLTWHLVSKLMWYPLLSKHYRNEICKIHTETCLSLHIIISVRISVDSCKSDTGHWHALVSINRQIPEARRASHNYFMNEGTVSNGQVIVFATKQFPRTPFFIILPAFRVTFELLTQFSTFVSSYSSRFIPWYVQLMK